MTAREQRSGNSLPIIQWRAMQRRIIHSNQLGNHSIRIGEGDR
jgi:hypothetical protein